MECSRVCTNSSMVRCSRCNKELYRDGETAICFTCRKIKMPPRAKTKYPRTRKRKQWTEESLELMKTMRTECYTLKDIGAFFDVDHSTIIYWLRKMGVPKIKHTPKTVIPMRHVPVKLTLQKRMELKKGKYDDILYERVSQGHSYAEYCRKAGIKVPKNDDR